MGRVVLHAKSILLIMGGVLLQVKNILPIMGGVVLHVKSILLIMGGVVLQVKSILLIMGGVLFHFEIGNLGSRNILENINKRTILNEKNYEVQKLFADRLSIICHSSNPDIV
jgi:hypothetical protein